MANTRIVRIKQEPKCPECGSGVMRPKCFYELGGPCPRHDVRHEFERLCGGEAEALLLMMDLDAVRRPQTHPAVIAEMAKRRQAYEAIVARRRSRDILAVA